MKVLQTGLAECRVFEPRVYEDQRGHFYETFNVDRLRELGFAPAFVQGNISESRAGVLRGLHYQWPRPQGKLVSVIRGEAWDVAVDVRRGSPDFGRWSAVFLSEHNRRQFWIPAGFAHGFASLTDGAILSYLCTDTYDPATEACIAWDDPDLGIHWPVAKPILSAKDAAAPRLVDIAVERLPAFVV